MTTHDDPRLQEAFAILDGMHREEPAASARQENILASLGYHQRLSQWVERLAPQASAALRLAARSQHVRRWSIPRDSYPMTRKGYRDWRDALARFHARTAAEVLARVGYAAHTVTRVQQLLQKERLRTDPEAQTLQDAVCLVFLEVQLEAFSRQHSEEKLLIFFAAPGRRCPLPAGAWPSSSTCRRPPPACLAKPSKGREWGVEESALPRARALR